MVDLFERASPAVVYITTLAERTSVFGFTRSTEQGTGTGFLWDLNGHIVTNYHVLQGATGPQVVLQDQATHDAEYIGGSSRHDLAVLRINPPAGTQQVAIGDSETLRVDQTIYAIGNPFRLSYTLSTGIVSALGRRIENVDGTPIEDVIQIDATINQGNSWGGGRCSTVPGASWGSTPRLRVAREIHPASGSPYRSTRFVASCHG